MCIRDREQTAKQLPAPELIAHAAEEKAEAEAKSEEQEREIARLRSAPTIMPFPIKAILQLHDNTHPANYQEQNVANTLFPSKQTLSNNLRWKRKRLQ